MQIIRFSFQESRRARENDEKCGSLKTAFVRMFHAEPDCDKFVFENYKRKS